MPSTILRKSAFLALAFLFLSVARASAQAPLEPAQLPARTVFYLIWRGTPPVEARKASALFALWDDPDLAPVRSALFESILSDSAKDKSANSLSAAEFSEYSTLLDNPFVFGYLSEPPAHRSAPSADASISPNPWNGLFFVYDRTGKEALLAKAILRIRSQDKDMPKLSPLTIAGVPALKVESKSGTMYWAESGKFAVSAKERSVFEDILSRAAGKSPEASSLAQNAFYQEAKPLLGTGLFEFFLRIADLKDLVKDSSPSGAKTAVLLDAVKLESVHSIALHLSLEGAKTRVQGALLGDASSGTLFDIFSEGQQTPASFAYLSPETVYYQETHLNLLGIYENIKRVMRSALPPNQQGSTDMVEAMAKQRIGMPLQEALALPSGEFGSLQTSATFDFTKQIYFLGIQKKPDTLKLIRTILGDRLTSERNDGSTTYLKISLQGNQSSSGVAQWNFYHLAVTPNLILGAMQSESLRAMLAQGAQPAALTQFTASPAFLAARAQFPEKLSGFSYFDFQKMDWPALKEKYVELLKTASDRQQASTKSPSPRETSDWLKRLNPQVIPRHLHTATSASWKDAKGVHFDEWLD